MSIQPWQAEQCPARDVHILIPRTGEYVSSHGKRDFADVIELRILRWSDPPGLFGWALSNPRSSYKREAGGSESGEEMWWKGGRSTVVVGGHELI